MAYKFWQQKKILAAAALLGVFLLFQLTGLRVIPVWLAAPIFKSGRPFYELGSDTRNFWTGLTRGLALPKRLAEQEERIADLTVALAQLQPLASENRELKDLWQWRESRSENIIPAGVIFFSQTLNKQMLIINRGQKDGLIPGLAAVAKDGILIGKVSQVYEDMAAVLLTTDGQSTIAAAPAGAGAVQAIVRGKLGISLTMELIPQDTALAAGDLVVTSALEENTPAGLIVGRVASVLYREGELFKRANLEPVISSINLQSLGIILPLSL